jgi:hypothetical protein
MKKPTLMAANLSRGVFCRLQITNLAFLPTFSGTLQAGVTVKELPSTRHRSDSSALLKAVCIVSSGRFSPTTCQD